MGGSTLNPWSLFTQTTFKKEILVKGKELISEEKCSTIAFNFGLRYIKVNIHYTVLFDLNSESQISVEQEDDIKITLKSIFKSIIKWIC